MKLLPTLVPLALLALLGACSSTSVRDTLGINKNAPDEFVVVSRPPLSLPPEFELRPPKPGEAPRIPSTEEEARRQLLGTPSQSFSLDGGDAPAAETSVAPVITADTPSGATSNFLSRFGAEKADGDIREKLSTDSVAPPTKEAESLYEEILGSSKPEPTVDAKKEAERLRGNKDAGKPATEGEVPTSDDKPPSVIDTLF
jgi:hypothetical protein